ncbi:MAG: DNA polymerase III subunit gamma/tau [Alistipes sp.]|nr:DNA polymerase III subunit gamma/tau [Alistipes sp.]
MGNFIVSARKYRPATFASVVGQKHITSTLKNAIERGQLAHAYLFCGPRGVGKTTCARIFAKAINCLHPAGAEACNECESCRTFNENRSLNIHELDAASNNSVDDIRNLIEQVRIIPQVGRYSVFIIDEVHMLSQQAFNAFLKTLEEPPAHAIFILATTEKHKIIPTILSRCQIYDFNRIRVEDAVEYLKQIADKEGVTYDEESLNLIARKADGGMRDALSMFDKAVSFCGTTLGFKEVAQTLNVLDYDTYFQMTDMLLDGNYVDALLLFDRILSNGFSGQIFMAGLCQHMRDLLVAKGPALSLIEFTGTLLERYRSQAERCDNDFLFGAISLLADADGKIRQSSNQRLLVELGLMKIAVLGQKKNDPTVGADDYPLPDLRKAALAAAQPTSPAAHTTAQGGSQTVPAAMQPTTQAAPQATASTASAAPAQTATVRQTPQQPVQPAPEQQSATTNTMHNTAPSAPPSQPAATAVGGHMAATSVGGTATSAATVNAAAVNGGGTYASRSDKPLMSGASLSALLNTTDETVEAKETTTIEKVIDPESAAKLENNRQHILNDINERRPRFIVAFETMRFENNIIRLSVPTEALRDEILRSTTEILMRIAEIAGIAGSLELDIAVREDRRKMRPIKLEDRIRHIEQKNPLVLELKKALDLEVE